MKFFQLKSEPFHITPDPEFLFLSPSHKEALASVLYGVEKRKGFIMLTGEVGLGKTTIVRSFLKRQRGQRADTEAANAPRLVPLYLFNSNLTFGELVQTILKGLQADAGPMPVAEMVNRLHWALIAAYREGHNVALFIDEAQNMPVETLESLRMLSNLETHSEKLLQIVLIGQPELEEKLGLSALRQLRQRIAVQARLEPLTRKESIGYIRHRLAKAALLPARVFSDAALAVIARRSHGCPRTINIICDNALVAAYGSNEKPVSARLVRRVASEMRMPCTRLHRLWWALAGGLALSLLVALAALLPPVRWAVAMENAGGVPVRQPSNAIDAAAAPAKAEATPTETLNKAAVAPSAQAVTRAADSQPAPPEEDWAFHRSAVGLDALVAPWNGLTVDTELPPDAPAPVPDEVSTPQSWRVRPGETLSSIARQVYGLADVETLQMIRDMNPQISDQNMIRTGDELTLPSSVFEPAESLADVAGQ